jgi:hypothetical protein
VSVTHYVHAAYMNANLVPERDLPGSRCLIAPTPTALVREVAGLVEACLQHGDCYFIIEAPEQHRYVQGLVQAGSGFWLESVSDFSLANCCEEHRLTANQERTLKWLAWRPPDNHSPNWYRVLDTTRDPSSLAAELLVRTLAEVHRTKPRSRLHVSIGRAIGSLNRKPVERQQRSC